MNSIEGTKSTPAGLGSYTIPQLCEMMQISQATYHIWKKKGWGPTEIQVGQLVRISYEAAAEWMRKLATRKEAEADRARLHKKGLYAGACAMASPTHVSKRKCRTRRRL